MKTVLLLIGLLLILSINLFAQTDSIKNRVNTSLTLATKNLWRGNVYGNNVPMMSGTLTYKTRNNFEIGAIGTSPVSGNRLGYGIWMEVFASKTIERITFTIDDYYFFNAQDSLNDYLNWNRNNTQHFVEGRIKYGGNFFSLTGSYVLYSSKNAVNNIYLETEIYLVPGKLSVLAGGVFGRSDLNFFDKGGVAFVGLTGYKSLDISCAYNIPVWCSLIVSPNYKNASKYDGFTQNPINIIIGLILF